MTSVSRRAKRFRDRSGDPLDGLVNLFDVGVVLAVAFLLAALSSPAIAQKLTKGTRSTTPTAAPTSSNTPAQVQRTVPPGLAPATGYGTPVGRVYRLPDGRLVYVVPRSVTPSSAPTPSPTR